MVFTCTIPEKSTKDRVLSVLLVVLRLTAVFLSLYVFICSLSFLSSAFQLLGGKSAGEVSRVEGGAGGPEQAGWQILGPKILGPKIALEILFDRIAIVI